MAYAVIMRKVIIACTTFNHWEVTRCFIDSTKKIKDKSLKQIIFVDNGSTDITTDYLKKLEFTVLRTPYNSVAVAHNVAFNYDKECDVLMVANDHILTNGIVDTLVSIKDRNNIGLISPFTFCSHINLLDMDPIYNRTIFEQYLDIRYRILAKQEAHHLFVGILKWLYPEGVNTAAKQFTERHKDDPEFYDGIWPGCCLYSREAINAIGAYDENFIGAGYEDMDYFRRTSNKQVKAAYTTKAFIHHFGSITTRKFAEADEYMSECEQANYKYYTKKYGGG